MILSSTEDKMPWENNADTKALSKNTFDVILETNTDYKIYPTIRADDDTFYQSQSTSKSITKCTRRNTNKLYTS